MLFRPRIKRWFVPLLSTWALSSCDDSTSPPIEPASTEQRSSVEATFESEFLPNMQGGFHRFGWAVAISGDTLVAGAPGATPPPPPGLAYVFVRNGSNWVEQAVLESNAASGGALFGLSVAMVGDLLVVGSASETIGSNMEQGAVHVFVRNGTAWTEEPMITATDGLDGDAFGFSVAMSGDTLLVGAPGVNNWQGAVYAFVRNGASWTEQAKFVTNDAGDRFGRVLALDGDNAVILNGDPGGLIRVTAYVFTRNGPTWTQTAQLSASPSPPFGLTAAISGDTVFVGAYADWGGGAAYVFVHQSSSWDLQAKLVACDQSPGDNFDWFCN